MALVCAAMSCPPLRREPYQGRRLDEQLDDQTRRFLAHPEKSALDRERKRVGLSAIFDWFGHDFVPGYLDQGPEGFEKPRRAALGFVGAYLEPADRKWIRSGDYEVRILPYDWSLNDQRGGD
jgi:hypothetical protein